MGNFDNFGKNILWSKFSEFSRDISGAYKCSPYLSSNPIRSATQSTTCHTSEKLPARTAPFCGVVAYWRETKLLEIAGGSTQIQKNIIVKNLLRQDDVDYTP